MGDGGVFEEKKNVFFQFSFLSITTKHSPNRNSRLRFHPDRQLQRSACRSPALPFRSVCALCCERRKVTRFGMEAPASKYLEDTDQTLFTLRGGERAAGGIIEEKHELLRPEEAQVHSAHVFALKIKV